MCVRSLLGRGVLLRGGEGEKRVARKGKSKVAAGHSKGGGKGLKAVQGKN